MAWIPWDADETEQQDLQVIRDQIPETMRPGLKTWLFRQLNDDRGTTGPDRLNGIQSALRVSLANSSGSVRTSDLVTQIEGKGDQFLLRVVDLLVSEWGSNGPAREPQSVKDLRWHFDTAASAIDIAYLGNCYRLKRRLPDGVEDASQLSVYAADTVAGTHLARALREVQSLDPNTSTVMTESIRAVEAAAGAVVIPKDRKPSMGKIVGRLREKRDWSLRLQRRDDGHPDHEAVVLGMLETLAFAEQHRHSGHAPTQQEAQSHALLAATLVGWFATDAIVMEGK